jgi:hypothetical protein
MSSYISRTINNNFIYIAIVLIAYNINQIFKTTTLKALIMATILKIANAIAITTRRSHRSRAAVAALARTQTTFTATLSKPGAAQSGPINPRRPLAAFLLPVIVAGAWPRVR